MGLERDAIQCVRAVVRCDNARDAAGYRALLHDDYQAHVHGAVTVASAQDEVAGLEQWWQAAPDVVLEIEALHCDGDMVTLRYTLTGTQSGPLRGLPASGRPFRIHNCTVLEVLHGRVSRTWRYADTMGLMTQLGLAGAAD